ncbi:MAG: TRAP transporter small permease [Candidatus Latescibacterota bacterium]
MSAPQPASLAALLRCLHRLEDAALVVLVAALLLLSFAQILLRTLSAVAWLWAEPLARHLVLWSCFLGALIATRQDRHIRIDALLRMSPVPARRLMEGTASLCSAALCLALAGISVQHLRNEHALGGRPFLGIPAWELQLIFPLAFGGMGLRFLHRLLVLLRAPSRQGPA